MKIGIFLPELNPERGGAFTFVETVVEGLASSARDSLVVFHYGPAIAHFAGKPVTFHSLAKSNAARIAKKTIAEVTARLQRPMQLASAVFKTRLPYPPGSPLDAAARAYGIDLMLFPTPEYEQVECPFAITIWDLEHRNHPYFPELAARGEWTAREHYFGGALRRATFIITGTEVGAGEIVRFYGAERGRIRILPHPTPAFALNAGDVPPPKVPTPYVFYPAQFWAHKNHVGLVDAMAALARRNVTMHCAFVGSDKGNRAHVERCAKDRGIADRIHFLGFVERAELVALYRHAHALVYSSLCGPENLPPLEAMALGCPVINADIPGAREQLGDAALLVDALNPEALADAIERISSVRDELVAKGHARARRYTQIEFGRDLRTMIDEFRVRRNLYA